MLRFCRFRSFIPLALVHRTESIYLLFNPAANGSSVTRFFQAMTRPMSRADEVLCFRCLQPHVVSFYLLTSCIYSSLSSDWRCSASVKIYIQVRSVSTEELVFPRHPCCVLSRLRCNGHSLLLNSYLSIIDRIENPSFSPSDHPTQYILSCPATDSLRRLDFCDSFFLCFL